MRSFTGSLPAGTKVFDRHRPLLQIVATRFELIG